MNNSLNFAAKIKPQLFVKDENILLMKFPAFLKLWFYL